MSDAKFIELVTAAHACLTPRQEHLRQTFGLASYERWDWDGERGTVVFSSGIRGGKSACGEATRLRATPAVLPPAHELPGLSAVG
jgi:hypothetical protein